MVKSAATCSFEQGRGKIDGDELFQRRDGRFDIINETDNSVPGFVWREIAFSLESGTNPWRFVDQDTLEAIVEEDQKRINAIGEPDRAGAIPLPQCSSGVGDYVTKDSIHHRDSDSIKVDSSDPVNGCFCKSLLCLDSLYLAHAEKIERRDKIKISYITHLLGFG